MSSTLQRTPEGPWPKVPELTEGEQLVVDHARSRAERGEGVGVNVTERLLTCVDRLAARCRMLEDTLESRS